MHSIPITYLPSSLSPRDRKRQRNALIQSRKQYKSKKYKSRPRLKSFCSRPSPHVKRLREMYGVKNAAPTLELSRATKCSLSALKEIVRKGEGAFYSSGSRPNQTPQSWAYARLASALTGYRASQIDFYILEKSCSYNSRALKLARQTKNRSSRKNIE